MCVCAAFALWSVDQRTVEVFMWLCWAAARYLQYRQGIDCYRRVITYISHMTMLLNVLSCIDVSCRHDNASVLCKIKLE